MAIDESNLQLIIEKLQQKEKTLSEKLNNLRSILKSLDDISFTKQIQTLNKGTPDEEQKEILLRKMDKDTKEEVSDQRREEIYNKILPKAQELLK